MSETNDLLDETNPDDRESTVEPMAAPAAPAAPTINLDEARARVAELRAIAARARADADDAAREANELERELNSVPEPTLQELNEYAKRLDAGMQEERAELRQTIARLGIRHRRSAPHPPLFNTAK